MSARYVTPLDPAIAAEVEKLDEAEREAFEEFAAVREHMGGFQRQTAEALAWLDILERRKRRPSRDDRPSDDPNPSP